MRAAAPAAAATPATSPSCATAATTTATATPTKACDCVEGEVQACYSGPPELLGIGACQEGEQTCDINGVWGDCVGEGLPSEELCDGIDNDCNDQVDEGFGSITCGQGICQVTVEACVDGEPQPCIPGDPNPTEACDGFDDDCDGGDRRGLRLRR